MTRFDSYKRPLFTAENRFCYFSINNIPNHPPVQISEYQNWISQTDGAQEFLDSFRDGPVDVDVIKGYFEEKAAADTPLTALDREIETALTDLKSSDPAVRDQANNSLERLVRYANARNTFFDEAQYNRTQFATERVSTPFIDNTIGAVKAITVPVIEGFKQADGKEKMLMLAGAAVAVMLMRSVYAMLPGKGQGGLKKVAGAIVGTGVLIMAFEALNKSMEKTRGTPLISKKLNGSLFPEFSAWDKDTLENDKAIEEAVERLKGAQVPQSFIDEMGIPDVEKKTVIAIDALGDMNVESFVNMYEQARDDGKRIPDHSALYSPIVPDQLNPTERFALVEDMAKTIGLVDSNGDVIEDVVEKSKGEAMLYMMLHWER